MAKLSSTITVKTEVVKLYLVFFPLATYKRIDDVAILRMFGVPVYRRVGNAVNVLGFNWTRAHAS